MSCMFYMFNTTIYTSIGGDMATVPLEAMMSYLAVCKTKSIDDYTVVNGLVILVP